MTIKFARRPPEVTLREVRLELVAQISIIANSFVEADGVVRDEAAIRTVGCLRTALKLLPSTKP